MPEHVRRLGAECLGTFMVCLIAILAAASAAGGDAGRTATALAYGLGVLAAMQLLGAEAPVHVNPAVTLAVFATGRVGPVRFVACLAGQVVGGCLAGLTAMWLLNGAGSALGMPVGSFTKTDAAKTVVVEAFLAFVWAGVHLTATMPGRVAIAPLAVGLAVTAAALAGQPFTGAAMNPVRALAAAVAAVDFSTLWLYATGPLAGAAVAGMVGRMLPPLQGGSGAAKKG